MAVSLGAALTMMKNTVTGFSLAALSDGSLLRLGLDRKDYAALALSCTVLLAVSLSRKTMSTYGIPCPQSRWPPDGASI